MTQARANTYAGMQPKRSRFGLGCLLSILTLLVLLLLVIGAGFVFFVRPYAQSQLDQAMGDAVDQIPGAVMLLPPGPISIDNSFLTSMISSNVTPEYPVKNPQAVITQQGVQITLEVLGQQSSIQGLPQLVNGQLKATNVQVGGLMGLVISPDEATAMINRHLADAQAKLKHPIQSIQLQNGRMTLLLGAPSLL
ncbi:MAG TPA: hypothetical protein VL485_07650 [Ktedonobacteraceae bacterium]|jgi:hypothetical protein|nr:hypothetical protein [Ktedonobacteraceae bacterium]